jgi:hypothetical protein
MQHTSLLTWMTQNITSIESKNNNTDIDGWFGWLVDWWMDGWVDFQTQPTSKTKSKTNVFISDSQIAVFFFVIWTAINWFRRSYMIKHLFLYKINFWNLQYSFFFCCHMIYHSNSPFTLFQQKIHTICCIEHFCLLFETMLKVSCL